MTMIAQPYPLWCVEASRAHGIFVGRVIGWVQTQEDEDDSASGVILDHKPIIVGQRPDDGTLIGISGPIEWEQLFIGDDPAQLRRQATAWMRGQGYEEPTPRTTPGSELDAAMHSVWLHGDWRLLTTKMTSEEREAAAAAVERSHNLVDAAECEPVGPLDPSELRWWL